MDVEAEARRDVEETLKTGADALELAVARARLGLFTALTLFTLILSVRLPGGGGAKWPLPSIVFGADAVYALLVWRRVRREGARPAFTNLVAFTDILAVTFSVILLRLQDPTGAGLAEGGLPPESVASRFDLYCLAPVFLTLLFLTCLRMTRGLRLAFSMFALVAYLVAIRLDVGRFELPQFLAAILIGVGGILGAKTSDRIAGMLGRNSRLTVLRRYLPGSFAERVSSDSIDLGAALRAQALEVTLLVADLRGFTAMSEALAPAEVVALLAEYHEAMLGPVEKNGGVVDKFLGDGMLVVFGLPGPQASSRPDAGAALAVACAASMLERLADLNLVRQKAGQKALAMGIGIHTGPVIAGTIGAGQRREFTVIGDAVNTASRLESLTKTADQPVLISASTVARLGAEAVGELRELPPMAVKGKAEPLRIFARG